MFYYGRNPRLDTLRSATRRCRDAYGAANGRVVWFSTGGHTTGVRTRVLLKDFTPGDEAGGACGDPDVSMLDDCPADLASTFEAFTQATAEPGFAFLNQRRRAGQVGDPILVTQHNGAIVGAIGPLTIMPDRFGARMLLPQYFGVLPNRRGTGHGRALWRAAQRWAAHHHADYQLLQTTVGGPSDRLFLAEGLRTLGFAATAAA
jgi:GNAT superfamily N-acetyltransferase